MTTNVQREWSPKTIREDLLVECDGSSYVVRYDPVRSEYGGTDHGHVTAERLERTYAPGGEEAAPLMHVLAVGRTPEHALRKLARKVRWGRLADFDELGGDGPKEWTWGRVFTTGRGTWMKAGGFHVPGGVVVTWLK